MDVSLEKKNKRLEWLDFGKAIGILVVLMVHAECSLGAVTYYGGMFYMPVFFVAAGYTFKSQAQETMGSFLKKKAKRLLVPYFGTSLFLWLFFWIKDSVLSGNPLDFKLHSIMGILYSRNQMYVSSYTGENPVLLDLLNAPLWFLTAIFLTYVWYEAISRSTRKYELLTAGLVASIIWHYSTGLLLPWSLDAVPYFAYFLALGESLRGKKGIHWLMERWHRIALVFLVFIAMSRINGSVNLSCGSYGKSMLICLAVGSLGSILVFAVGIVLEKYCGIVIKVFGWIGQETLVILCFHMFLFMFIRSGAGLLGLGTGITQAALVLGSAAVLTIAGRLLHCRK